MQPLEHLIFPFSRLYHDTGPAISPQKNKTPDLSQLTSSIKDWLKTQNPDVVVGVSDIVYHALAQCGLRIPEDISFLCLAKAHPDEATPKSQWVIRSTGYRRSFRKMVIQAFRLLEQILKFPPNSEDGPLRVVMPSRFMEGNTLSRGPIQENSSHST